MGCLRSIADHVSSSSLLTGHNTKMMLIKESKLLWRNASLDSVPNAAAGIKNIKFLSADGLFGGISIR